MRRTALLPLLLAALCAPAFAQTVTIVKPACGAAGDRILLVGEDFGDAPTVTVNGEEAEVLGSRADRIVFVLPDGLDTGAATIAVDDTEASDIDFTVLADGSPIVHRISPSTATPGTRILVIGLRLKGAEAEFVDADDDVAATVDLTGYDRAGFLQVPDDLAADTYTLRIKNADGDSGACSPTIEIVEAGDPAISAIEPESALPGQHVIVEGTDLGPAGLVRVSWTDADDETLNALGFSNGYDKVFTRVPRGAVAGGTYDVAVHVDDETATDPFEYEVGTLPDPAIDEIDPSSGPAGSIVRITGEGLVARDGKPTVEMTSGSTTIAAKVLFAVPGFLGHPDTIVAVVPGDAEDGEYDVTVTVGDNTSDAVTFEVKTPDLAVTSMFPKMQRRFGNPVHITGAGFGNKGGDPIAVTWDGGSGADPRAGKVILRRDNRLLVFPPGFPPFLSQQDPLAKGTYTVVVTLNPGTDAEESVEAGEYTVK